MHDAALVVFTGIACVLILLPFPIHLRARNYAILFNICWLFLMNLTMFINSVHFWDHSENDIPVFCDIAVKISTSLGTAISACSLCINRRLAAIAASRQISMSQRQKRINLAIDIFLCVGFPIIIMGLSYIPQAQRFLVVEGLGCAAGLLRSLPAVLLVYIWPVVLGAISVVYGLIAIWHFLARRLQFQTLLKSSQSGLSTGQFFRLMAMANADLVIGMPLNMAILITKSQDLVDWPGLDVVHANWGFVREIPESAIDLYYFDSGAALAILSGWFAPLLAFLFFIFFGVTEDAVREYSRWLPALRRKLGMTRPTGAAQYVPKLGTAIARPAGYDWHESHSVKDNDLERGFQDIATVPAVGHSASRPGVAVSVQVDRQVV